MQINLIPDSIPEYNALIDILRHVSLPTFNSITYFMFNKCYIIFFFLHES